MGGFAPPSQNSSFGNPIATLIQLGLLVQWKLETLCPYYHACRYHIHLMFNLFVQFGIGLGYERQWSYPGAIDILIYSAGIINQDIWTPVTNE